MYNKSIEEVAVFVHFRPLNGDLGRFWELLATPLEPLRVREPKNIKTIMILMSLVDPFSTLKSINNQLSLRRFCKTSLETPFS